MTRLEQLQALTTISLSSLTANAIGDVMDALPELIRVAQAAKKLTFDLDGEARRLVLVGGFEELQEALAPFYHEAKS